MTSVRHAFKTSHRYGIASNLVGSPLLLAGVHLSLHHVRLPRRIRVVADEMRALSRIRRDKFERAPVNRALSIADKPRPAAGLDWIDRTVVELRRPRIVRSATKNRDLAQY